MNLYKWRKVQITDIFIDVQRSETCQHFAPQISPSITYYSPPFIKELHSYQDPKEVDLETSSSISSFLLQKIKEEIISHPQVEIMRWLINWWLSTFICWAKLGKFLKNRVQRSLCISQTVINMKNIREGFGYETVLDKNLFFLFNMHLHILGNLAAN